MRMRNPAHYKVPRATERICTVICRVKQPPFRFEARGPKMCARCGAPLPDPQHEIRK